jgi:hypothetical protein
MASYDINELSAGHFEKQYNDFQESGRDEGLFFHLIYTSDGAYTLEKTIIHKHETLLDIFKKIGYTKGIRKEKYKKYKKENYGN